MKISIVKNGDNDSVSAREIYELLNIKKKFSDWIQYSIKRALLEESKDFFPKLGISSGGRIPTDYLLKRDAAITIIVMSGGDNAKELRDYVIELFNQHNTGQAFTNVQIEALVDLSRSLTLVSIQEDVQKKHFELFNNKYKWHEHRAKLLGYNTKDLIEAMKKVNKKHSTIKESLVKLDSNELIRTGVIDLMMALGKSEEYAINTGNLCKMFSEKMQLGNIIWDDTIDNPLQINQSSVTERKELYSKSLKQLK